jgi:hypothetical protein
MAGLLSSSHPGPALRVSVSSSIVPAQGLLSFRSALEPVYVSLIRSFDPRLYILEIPLSAQPSSSPTFEHHRATFLRCYWLPSLYDTL